MTQARRHGGGNRNAATQPSDQSDAENAIGPDVAIPEDARPAKTKTKAPKESGSGVSSKASDKATDNSA